MTTELLSIYKIQTGMVLADDVFNDSAQLIVPKGVTISDTIINKLKYYHIDAVTVYKEGIQETIDSSAPMTHSQRVRESKEFQAYSQVFYEKNEEFHYQLNEIAEKNADINVNKLFETTSDILATADSSYRVFDMLHNMRHFDDSTYAHSLNVSIIASIMGKWLGLNEEDIKVLTVAGLLHDIGKLLIPQEIITKPGKLTDQEYTMIKNHPLLGYNLLCKQAMDPRISQAALFHHEKCDGSGYPLGRTGNDLPAIAKIITIVDIYEAMTANRVYRHGLCPFEVIRTFESEGFQKYDPKYILVFLKGIVQTYINETVELNDGRTGEIVLINDQSPANPMIKIGTDFVDLNKHPDLYIVNIL